MNIRLPGKLLLFLCMFGLLSVSLSAHAGETNWASFDCDKAKTQTEKLICSNYDLGTADIHMAARFHDLLAFRTDKAQVNAEQQHWLQTVRDACPDVACLQRVYADRIAAFKSALKNWFTLTRGTLPVCKAYLQRLNTTVYKTAAYNDRRENCTVQGFTCLHRVLLKMSDVREVYPILYKFVMSANIKHFGWSDIKWQDQISDTFSDHDIARMQEDLDKGTRKIWRYDPPIDIDNDGRSDDVEVWSNIFSTNPSIQCITPQDFDENDQCHPPRRYQTAFLLTDHDKRLDVQKTEAIFGSPTGGYPMGAKYGGGVTDSYRPVGTDIGIFEYQHTYYFDTFFDFWGDFQGKRRKDPKLPWTLGIFLRKDGKTRQVCEYHMTRY